MPQNNSTASDPLVGLLGLLLGENPAVQDPMQNAGQSLGQVLANISGTSNEPPPDSSGGGSFVDILGSMMGEGAMDDHR